jgi:hypothetical protein
VVPQAIRIDAGKKQSEAFPRTRQSILQALERITRSRVAANALSVIYSFPNPRAGAKPRAGLIMAGACDPGAGRAAPGVRALVSKIMSDPNFYCVI